MKAALFCDISNLYYCVGKRFEGRKLDYQKLLDQAKTVAPVLRAFAYGAQVKDEAAGFIGCLRKIGFEPKYKEPRVDESEKRPVRKADWEVGIAMDVVRMIERLTVVIIASANPVFVPLLQWIKEQVHCKVIVMACGISRELKEVADQWIEIGEDLLEEPKNVVAA